MTKRVVVTGMAGITALGDNLSTVIAALKQGQNAVVKMDDWQKYDGLKVNLAAPITDFKLPAHYTRKRIRSMSRVSHLSTRATELALTEAGLIDSDILTNGQMGIAYGSCSGSTTAGNAFTTLLKDHSTREMNANTYVAMMSHTTAVNTGLFFGIRGRVIPTSSACTSGSQGIGYAYEAIKYGQQQAMVAGGAEELCPTQSAVFDTLFAASTRNDTPKMTPRPYDKDRDGLIIGEGAGSLILEDADLAHARGAKPIAEIVGFATNCDAAHVTQPRAETMQICMQMALKNAGLQPEQIGYVNGHGTATELGDIAETTATHAVFGNQQPISSLKSYFGHTLGACGATEAWLAIEMMRSNWFAPTINLDNIDPRCAELDYITGQGKQMSCEYIMSNNFAFGGINTSLIFKIL
ncbi:beta-ketoacyl-ACP synthase [Shewanella intestini]|uniref:Beta-ketoacyl-ACP synthase n=1 Tax=Shewanella intestini TaxID=2017544 RepID=A0ABS5I2S4_9GAMM|nr:MULTISPECIES: beta-ketoacyl-ACP synthase [Shewanella]MBR9728327.1 beta-ketoacyl-ACP synthase [Shewanella intestini]MRG35792.1 beta-ketoacyl-ACP synthase [Shewanella sp. XMDDZSB0408]